jgi:hypothetical protein
MQRALDDMMYQRRRIIRADRLEAVCKFILLVTLCLTAYSCALTEQPAQGVYHGR